MEETLDQQTVTLEDLAKATELADALSRLEENEDFILVITEGLIKNLKDNIPYNFAKANENARKRMTEKLISIGIIEDYFQVVKENGFYAEKSLDEYNMSKVDSSDESIYED